MIKGKAARIAGFTVALGATASLVGFAASGTGAYFTDTHTGQINTSTGHVRVTTDPSDGVLNFTDLLPGNYQTNTINYTAHGTGAEDIWLVFPTTSQDGSNPSEAFTGNPSDTAGGGLGKFGHFALDSTGGAAFTSFNLNNPGTGTHSGSSCSTDATTGWGGSNQQAASHSDPTLIPFCAPPNAILLQSNMADGDQGHADLTFGYTPLIKNGQDAGLSKLVSYEIVATQHGVVPSDPNN
jgi:hypothetical protein